jgi:hypothetical protein
MKLSDFKKKLSTLDKISFELPNGELVAPNFHVTEVGSVNKNFIDCGGTLMNENRVNFQLWEANDYDHRLHPEKLLKIIELSQEKIGLPNKEIEVEYQGDTIGKYGIEIKGDRFLLTSLTTDCLAKDQCGITESKIKISMDALSSGGEICTPGGGCC